MSETVNPVVAKIRALLAKASDASVTEAEASAYAAKAAELLAKHNLEMVDVADAPVDPISHETWKQRYSNPWRRKLGAAIARLYFCELVWFRDGSHKLAGRPHNVAVAREMTTYLYATIERLAKTYARGRARSVLASYERGMAGRLINRIYDQIETMKSASPASATSGGLPALYDSERAAVDAYLGKIKIINHKFKMHDEHALAGWNEGDRVSLSPQVAASSRAPALPRA